MLQLCHFSSSIPIMCHQDLETGLRERERQTTSSWPGKNAIEYNQETPSLEQGKFQQFNPLPTPSWVGAPASDTWVHPVSWGMKLLCSLRLRANSS